MIRRYVMKSSITPFKITFITISFLCALSISTASFAGGSALKTMASILMGLNHYPSDSEKETLKGIVNGDGSGNQKSLATAMINLQHKAASSDIPKLKSITSDSKASQGEKDLATILLGLSHSASASDKAKLKSIM